MIASVLCFALPGCAFFSGKPPLPKHASIEHVGPPATSTDYSAVVANADVVYFPNDRAGSGARSEPAALLVEAFVKMQKPFAIGSDLIDASQQALLDELASAHEANREEIIGRLDLTGTGRAREHCRAVLREVRIPGVRHLALRFPSAILEKLSLAGALTPDEERLLPDGFAVPPGGMEAFAERLAAARAPHERSLASVYRSHVMRQEFMAETIVRHLRGAGAEAKLLVFTSSSDLEPGQGVPYYVAQKLQVRQAVLGPDLPRSSRGTLLARHDRDLRHDVEIVDRAPRTALD